jgi:hypothetical protein
MLKKSPYSKKVKKNSHIHMRSFYNKKDMASQQMLVCPTQHPDAGLSGPALVLKTQYLGKLATTPRAKTRP